jgi:hypothetical protein
MVFGPTWLLLRGVQRDPALGASGKSVRLLLIPGSVAVWPVLILVGRNRGGV